MQKSPLGYIIFLMLTLSSNAYAIEFLKNNDSFIFPGNIKDFTTQFPGEVFVDQESCAIKQKNECYSLVLKKDTTNESQLKTGKKPDNQTITVTIKPSTWKGSLMFSDSFLSKINAK